MKRYTLINATLLFILLAFTATAAQAQVVSYAAKFVCGRTEKLISAGGYFTLINVHNASPFKKVQYIKRFAIALPDEKPGKISEFFGGTLAPEEAMSIDCENIYKHTGVLSGNFLDGFVIIYALGELDVVSVYTAGHLPVETLHTERVPLRRVVVPRTHAIAERLRKQE